MTIFILLGIGLLFLLFTGIIIICDNKKRKYKKKMLRLHWRVLGIVCTIISVVCIIFFIKYCVNFNGVEAGDRKILLRSTMTLADISIPTNDATLDPVLTDCYKKIIKGIENGDDETKIKYVDALLNKNEIPLSDIHEVKYSKDLTKKQVQVVEYLVNCKDGRFTKPQIYYYIVFSEDLMKQVETHKKKK